MTDGATMEKLDRLRDQLDEMNLGLKLHVNGDKFVICKGPVWAVAFFNDVDEVSGFVKAMELVKSGVVREDEMPLLTR